MRAAQMGSTLKISTLTITYLISRKSLHIFSIYLLNRIVNIKISFKKEKENNRKNTVLYLISNGCVNRTKNLSRCKICNCLASRFFLFNISET